MIRLQNNYAITSSGGSFALVTFVKGKDKEKNEIYVQKPISYHTTLESALQSYSNNRMADLVSNFDMDLKDVKKAIDDLKREIKAYEYQLYWWFKEGDKSVWMNIKKHLKQ